VEVKKQHKPPQAINNNFKKNSKKKTKLRNLSKKTRQSIRKQIAQNLETDFYYSKS